MPQVLGLRALILFGKVSCCLSQGGFAVGKAETVLMLHESAVKASVEEGPTHGWVVAAATGCLM